jgi:hypothetical protein
MTQAEWNQVVDVLWSGAMAVIDSINDGHMRDALPETIAREAGYLLADAKRRADDLMSDAS